MLEVFSETPKILLYALFYNFSILSIFLSPTFSNSYADVLYNKIPSVFPVQTLYFAKIDKFFPYILKLFIFH